MPHGRRAHLTEEGGMLRTSHGIVVVDKEEDLIIVPFLKDKAGDIGKEIEQHRQCYGIMSLYASDKANLRGLKNDDCIFIWGHGNRKRECIATSDGTCVYASDIVNILYNIGLRPDFGGSIILWSCFAGVANGFATTLLLHLKTRGYNSVTVYGPNCPTAGFAYLPPKFDSKTLCALRVWGNGPAGVDMPDVWGKKPRRELRCLLSAVGSALSCMQPRNMS